MDQLTAQTNTVNQTPTVKKSLNLKKIKFNKKKFLKVLSIILIIFSVLFVICFFSVIVPGTKLKKQIETLKKEAPIIQQAITDKDLDKVKSELNVVKSQIKSVESTYKKFSYAKIIPVAKNYYNDGTELINISKEAIDAGNIVIQAIEPYKDFLGVKGAATSGEETTQDRISFLTQSVESLVPYMDTLEQKLSKIETSLNKIDPNRYPEEFKGIAIKSDLNKANEMVSQIHTFLKNGQPILSKTSWLLGKDSPRNYLLIFQNNAELRPTGGFWTAYGLIKIDNGKITPLASSDIYSLDAQIKSTIPAPRPIKAYHINVPYYNVRDMNISPDFPTSIKLFLENYEKVNKNTKIDAVISLDLDVLVDLVKVLGQVGVSGFGNFSAEPDTRCDGCPNIIYQLEELADKPKSYIDTNRKGFLGPLMNSLLSNAMGSEKSKMGPLMEAFFTNINQKHIMFYFKDTDMQKAGELANIAGTITQTDNSIDYFHLNDANMASAKSNLFITQKIKHEISTKNGKVTHKISITYTNPTAASNCNLEKGGLCLNAANYRDWFRFFVPTGSTMIKMTGSEVEPVKYEELGKQVFEGFYGNKYPLQAKSNLKTSIEYVSSVPASKNYSLLLQKQPGTKAIDYQLIVNGKEQETFSWVADKTIRLSL